MRFRKGGRPQSFERFLNSLSFKLYLTRRVVGWACAVEVVWWRWICVCVCVCAAGACCGPSMTLRELAIGADGRGGTAWCGNGRRRSACREGGHHGRVERCRGLWRNL